MPDTFDKLLAKGFKFVTVSELLAHEPALARETPGCQDRRRAWTSRRTPTATAPASPSANLPDKITGAPNQ